MEWKDVTSQKFLFEAKPDEEKKRRKKVKLNIMRERREMITSFAP